METAVIFFSGQALETAVADSARLIMTGQAQTAGFSQTQFKDAVCAKIYGLFNCQSGVYVDVKKFSNFAGVTMTSPIDSDGNFLATWGDLGTGDGEFIYPWSVSTNAAGWPQSLATYRRGSNPIPSTAGGTHTGRRAPQTNIRRPANR